MYCEVIVEKTSRNIDNKFIYKIKESHIKKVEPGIRVKVDFNGKLTEAFVFCLIKETNILEDKIKYIKEVKDRYPIISEKTLEVINWMREYYVCRYIDAVKLFYPPSSNYKIQYFFKSIKDGEEFDFHENQILELLKDGDKSFDFLYKNLGGFEFTYYLYNLLDKNIVEGYILDQSKNKNIKKIVKLELVEENIEDYNLRSNAFRQSDIIKQFLIENNIEIEVKALLKKSKSTLNALKSLIDKNILSIREVEDRKIIEKKDRINESSINLNKEQLSALKRILDSDERKHLIHGITGSGKTEIYMNIIKEYINVNKKIIMLFPEISLTNHMINRFKRRFGNRIAVIHSRMNTKEKTEEWMKINNDFADVIIGARSALFTPVKNIGAIIIDEEHEDSYNSSITPKYKTLDIAEKIAEINNCKIILGSATPSVTSYYDTLKKNNNLIEIKNRVNDSKIPKIEVVDMKKELEEGNRSIFSRKLIQDIKETLNKEEQVILFLNKRGYASFVSCRNCGYVVRCDSCDVSMTYHSSVKKLICHYCGKTKSVPKSCPECGSKYIKSFGIGTQKIEDMAKKIFKDKIIDRMDFDTVTKRGAQEKIYKNLSNGKTDILIGTQMLAKGIHFPNVTLVGIMSADTTINLPFYSAGEKSFQLITQVSGRAGRGDKKGKVILQTYEPDHYSVKYAINNNYNKFIKQELMLRKEFKYPPFIRILYINTKSKDEKVLNRFNKEKYKELTKKLKNYIEKGYVKVYKPVPKGIYRINNEYQVDTIIKTKKTIDSEIKKILREIYFNKSYNNINITLEIDPNTIS